MKTKEKTLQIRRARTEKLLRNKIGGVYFSYSPIFSKKISSEQQLISFS